MTACTKLKACLHASARLPCKSFAFFTARGMHGNYDASSGTCCRMETAKCSMKSTASSKAVESKNECYKRTDSKTASDKLYPEQLLWVLRGTEEECDLIKHDVCFYAPSDKNRKYQRTWPECPYLLLQPKKVCCPAKELYPPIERREIKRTSTELSVTDKFLHQMTLACQSCRLGKQRPRRCKVRKVKSDCEKIKAPFPSFSECDHDCIKHPCDTECKCTTVPSMCEVWRMFHRNSDTLKKCTAAMARICTRR